MNEEESTIGPPNENYGLPEENRVKDVNKEIRNSLDIENTDVKLLPIPRDKTDFIEKNLRE